MKILINAISIHTGGAFVALDNLVKIFHQLDKNIECHVVGQRHVMEMLPDYVKKISYSWTKKSPLHLYYWYEIVLPKLVKKVQADVVFSHTNYLPRRKLTCPTLLLVQHAGHFSLTFTQLLFKISNSWLARYAWHKKSNWVYHSIKKADRVTVQTNALAQTIIKSLNIEKEKIITIPHGPGLLKINLQPRKLLSRPQVRVGYIAKLGVQKDFSTAIKAINLLNKKNISAKLVLTISQINKGLDAKLYDEIQNQIDLYQAKDIVELRGEVKEMHQLEKLYKDLDIFVFPSLCESFGFPLVEAMAAGLPLVAAATESNCEILEGSALTFAPGNAEQLAEKIDLLINNKELYHFCSSKILERAKYFCWEKTGKQLIDLLYSMQGIKNERIIQIAK